MSSFISSIFGKPWGQNTASSTAQSYEHPSSTSPSSPVETLDKAEYPLVTNPQPSASHTPSKQTGQSPINSPGGSTVVPSSVQPYERDTSQQSNVSPGQSDRSDTGTVIPSSIFMIPKDNSCAPVSVPTASLPGTQCESNQKDTNGVKQRTCRSLLSEFNDASDDSDPPTQVNVPVLQLLQQRPSVLKCHASMVQRYLALEKDFYQSATDPNLSLEARHRASIQWKKSRESGLQHSKILRQAELTCPGIVADKSRTKREKGLATVHWTTSRHSRLNHTSQCDEFYNGGSTATIGHHNVIITHPEKNIRYHDLLQLWANSKCDTVTFNNGREDIKFDFNNPDERDKLRSTLRFRTKGAQWTASYSDIELVLHQQGRGEDAVAEEASGEVEKLSATQSPIHAPAQPKPHQSSKRSLYGVEMTKSQKKRRIRKSNNRKRGNSSNKRNPNPQNQRENDKAAN